MAIISREEKTISLTITLEDVEEYNKYYFSKNSRRRKPAIDKPYHPSINVWMIMKRPMMNALKQRWKDFMVWFIERNSLTGAKIDKCEMEFTTIYSTKRRHDVDNTTPKFILDGFTEAGLIVDDDETHVRRLTLETGYDKENPRTEIKIYILE